MNNMLEKKELEKLYKACQAFIGERLAALLQTDQKVRKVAEVVAFEEEYMRDNEGGMPLDQSTFRLFLRWFAGAYASNLTAADLEAIKAGLENDIDGKIDGVNGELSTLENRLLLKFFTREEIAELLEKDYVNKTEFNEYTDMTAPAIYATKKELEKQIAELEAKIKDLIENYNNMTNTEIESAISSLQTSLAALTERVAALETTSDTLTSKTLMNYKGSVKKYSLLPSDAEVGDTYSIKTLKSYLYSTPWGDVSADVTWVLNEAEASELITCVPQDEVSGDYLISDVGANMPELYKVITENFSNDYSRVGVLVDVGGDNWKAVKSYEIKTSTGDEKNMDNYAILWAEVTMTAVYEETVYVRTATTWAKL